MRRHRSRERATLRSHKTVPRPGFPVEVAAPPPRLGPVMRRDSAEALAYKARVAALPCVLCRLLGTPQYSKTDVHHPRTGCGAGQRHSDFLGIALCHAVCHQGPDGIHGTQARLRLAGVSELMLLAETIRCLQRPSDL